MGLVCITFVFTRCLDKIEINFISKVEKLVKYKQNKELDRLPANIFDL